ncbi:Ig-like domain-containing protein [Brucella intermedia]|uniref:Ig-like domain-containing protein n=1 Tax=Brucella intermedia TaxID=94625 RepID=UPI00124D5E7C|nr:hypothetical protein [Brucella intermedia]KAB2727606.1 hypothetical protein F9L02_17265 [Brucella intermedia]
MTDPTNQSGIVLNVDAEMNIEMITDGSPADGATENVVQAWLDNDGDYISDIVLTFEIVDGNAEFVVTNEAVLANIDGETISDNKKKINIKANPAMYATANFTDMTGETGSVRVYPVVNNNLVKETQYTFQQVVLPDLDLSVKTDNVIANNTDYDEVIATLTHNGTQPFADQSLTFTLPQGTTATFENGLTTYTDKTLNDGTLSAFVKNSVAGTVAVTCTLDSNHAVTKTTNITFAAGKPTLRLVPYYDNALADNKAYDGVAAILKKSDGTGFVGQKINFSAQGGVKPRFAYDDLDERLTSPFSLTTTTGGEIDLFIFDTSTTDDSFTLKAELDSDPTVTSSIDVHFKGTNVNPPQPVINQFDVAGNITLGVSNDGTPCQVVAEIYPASDTPATNCFIRFSSFDQNGLVPNLVHISKIDQLSGKDSAPTYTDAILVQYPRTTYPVNVHYMGAEEGSARIKAELIYDATGGVFATSNPSELVNFKKSPPPPPPPPHPAVVSDFELATFGSGESDDGTPVAVVSYVQLTADSPTTDYFVRYYQTSDTDITPGQFKLTPPGVPSGHGDYTTSIDVKITATSEGAQNYALAHDLESKSGYAYVGAELWTLDLKTKVQNAKNFALAQFEGTTPPPPPPPVDNYDVKVTPLHNPGSIRLGQGCIARVYVKKNGVAFNGATVNCSLIGADYMTYWALTPDERTYVTTTSTTTCVGTTHSGGYFDVTFAEGDHSRSWTFQASYMGKTDSYPFFMDN